MNRHNHKVANLDRIRGIAAYNLFHPQLAEELHTICRRSATTLDMPLTAVQAVLDTATATLATSGGDMSTVLGIGGPNEYSLCPQVVIDAAPLVIDDLRQHPIYADNPAVQAGLIRSYAGVPLTLPTGHILGSYCAMSSNPHTFTDTDINHLHTTTAEILTVIGHYELSSATS